MEPLAAFVAALVAATVIGRFLLKIRPVVGTDEVHEAAWKDAVRACGLEDVRREARSLGGRSGALQVSLVDDAAGRVSLPDSPGPADTDRDQDD